MLDLVYELSPVEDIACIDGHFIVLLVDNDPISDILRQHCLFRLERLDDMSEFLMAAVGAADYPLLVAKASELPVLLHFRDGVERDRIVGLDDCLEFLEEFIISNSRGHVRPYCCCCPT